MKFDKSYFILSNRFMTLEVGIFIAQGHRKLYNSYLVNITCI